MIKAELFPLSGGEPIVVPDDIFVVGRTDDCDLRLDHPKVSSHHCILACWSDRLVIRDLQSKNGTMVNGKPIGHTKLVSDDMISVAGVEFRVSVQATADPVEQSDALPDGVQQRADNQPLAAALDATSNQLDLLTSGWEPGATVFEDCHLIEQIGRGGFGEVWKAEKEGVGPIAVKRIPVTDPDRSELRALKAMKGLRHRNLVRVFGYRIRDDVLVIALELGEQTLEDRFRECRAQQLPGIPQDELVADMMQAAEALDYLYSTRKLMHRDVKPSNLLYVRGTLKVCDFGLAKVLANRQQTHSGFASFDFAPPEFFESQIVVSSDQFSLAATYCYLLAGQKPYPGPSIRQIAAQQVRGEPVLDGLPKSQRDVVRRALRRNPDGRYPSCAHFAMALARAARSQPTNGADG